MALLRPLIPLWASLIGYVACSTCGIECKTTFTCLRAVTDTEAVPSSAKPPRSRAATLFLRRKAATHDSEIRHLYEEMEAQIRNEKERLLLKVASRFGL